MSDVRLARRGIGYEFRDTDLHRSGVYATRDFAPGETVIIGVIERRTKRNYVHATAIGDGRYALHAGLVKLVRHACAPNCGVRVNQQGGHDIVAMRDLAEDEEVLIDYAMRNYDLDEFAWRCRCGAPSCRGVITGWRDLPAATRRAYRKFTAPYVLVCAARAEAAS